MLRTTYLFVNMESRRGVRAASYIMPKKGRGGAAKLAGNKNRCFAGDSKIRLVDMITSKKVREGGELSTSECSVTRRKAQQGDREFKYLRSSSDTASSGRKKKSLGRGGGDVIADLVNGSNRQFLTGLGRKKGGGHLPGPLKKKI